MDEIKKETTKAPEEILKSLDTRLLAIENNTGQMKVVVRDLYARPAPENKSRPALYFMVWTTVLGVLCSGPCTPPMSAVGSYYGASKESLELHIENVVGAEEPEKFYLINGQRAYLEIDGAPVEECF